MTIEKKDLDSTETPSFGASNISRDLIKHENHLINQRLTWFISLQGLLFAALSFGWDKPESHILVAVFSFLGVTTSISVALALWGGAVAIEKLSKIEQESQNTIIGRQARWIEKIFYPWFMFPVLFTIAWILLLLFKLYL